jgi:hypothetical protein
MPEIQYPTNPNTDTAFVVQDDGKKNRALMIAPQDISTLELPNNPNSTKGYVTIDGKKHRVNLVADITGGGGGGSYTAGNGISIDANNEISVTDPVLVNTATGITNALTIAGTPLTRSGINIGFGSEIRVDSLGRSVVIGNNAKAGDYSSGGVSSGGNVAIGTHAKASGYLSVAIGSGQTTHANYAIQIGASNATNSDANTFKVANNNGNFEIMSADGTVPTARLTKVNTTATLAVADWSSNTQTVTVSGVKADSVVFVSPDPTSASDYASAGILCTAQAADSLTFTCTTTPTNAIIVNVVCM